MYRIEAMTEENARIISTWRYAREYGVYSFTPGEDTLAELLGGEYYFCADEQGELIGYFCFGRAAQIPTAASYTADPDQTDIGLGMAPALCGHGRGADFLQSGIRYAKENLRAAGLRLVVAAFNKRAIAVYKSCGFVETGETAHKDTGMKFIVMQRAL